MVRRMGLYGILVWLILVVSVLWIWNVVANVLHGVLRRWLRSSLRCLSDTKSWSDSFVRIPLPNICCETKGRHVKRFHYQNTFWNCYQDKFFRGTKHEIVYDRW